MAKQRLDDMLGNELPAGDAPADKVDEVEQRAPRSTYSKTKTFGADEIMTPRLVLASGMSAEVKERRAMAGQWLLMGNEPVDEVTIVVAGHTPQRRYVPKDSSQALCYSPDGELGYGNPGTQPDGTHLACKDCPLSKWTDSGRKDERGKTINIRPVCDEVDSFLAFSVTHGMPVTFPLKGTGAKAARFIKTLTNGLGFGNFAITMTTEAKSGKGRSWHEPVIKIDPSISRDEANAYAMIAEGAVPIAEALPAGS